MPVKKSHFRTELAQVAEVCLGYRARVAARLVTRHYNAHFAGIGVTAVQFALLAGIELGNKPTIAALAAQAGSDGTTVTRNIGLLEERGLVIGQGGRGRSGKRLSLTPAGEELLARALPVWRGAYAALLGRIGRAEAGRGLAFLVTLGDAALSLVQSGD